LNITKKKTAILALALIALVATVSAGAYFIISNVIHKTVPVVRTDLVALELIDFPEFNETNPLKIGYNYTFNITTTNLADYELKNLTTYITIKFEGLDVNKTQVDELKPKWFYIYYEDLWWNGTVQDTFHWDNDKNALVSTAIGNGNWNACVGYFNNAKITFAIQPQSELANGTLTWDCWVESPSFP
jgi:flagellar basal body-associated protein FliL